MYYGERVKLRALEMSDLDNIMKGWNNFEMRRFLNGAMPMSQNMEKEWLEKATKAKPWQDGSITLAIEDKKTGEFLGVARFYDVKLPHRRASLGVSIYNPDQRTKGYGTDTTRLMLWFGFHVLGLHSVYLDTMEDNERAIHVAEKAGFRKIGVFRETEFVDGEYRGLLYMDILRKEFMEQYPPGTRIGDP